MARLPLEEWITSWEEGHYFCRPRWVQVADHFTAFVRPYTLVPGVIDFHVLEVSPSHRGRGILTRVLNGLERKYPIAITDINNIRLAKMLLRRGYWIYAASDMTKMHVALSPSAQELAGSATLYQGVQPITKDDHVLTLHNLGLSLLTNLY